MGFNIIFYLILKIVKYIIIQYSMLYIYNLNYKLLPNRRALRLEKIRFLCTNNFI